MPVSMAMVRAISSTRASIASAILSSSRPRSRGTTFFHAGKAFSAADEKELVFEGFLAFLDPPKESARESLSEMMKRGIEVKILSGDNERVNLKIAADVGLPVKGMITGEEIERASDEALKVLKEMTFRADDDSVERQWASIAELVRRYG